MTKIEAKELRGKNIYLRKVKLTDINDRYCSWLNAPEVNQYLETRFFPQTIKSIKEYVTQRLRSKDDYFFAICLSKNGKHIGNIKLGPVNPHHKFAEISLFIGEKNEWGKGYASEAIGLVTEFAFNKLGLSKLTAGCYKPNIGSCKAFQKAGFIIEGILPKQYRFHDTYVDKICLGRNNPNFNSPTDRK